MPYTTTSPPSQVPSTINNAASLHEREHIKELLRSTYDAAEEHHETIKSLEVTIKTNRNVVQIHHDNISHALSAHADFPAYAEPLQRAVEDPRNRINAILLSTWAGVTEVENIMAVVGRIRDFIEEGYREAPDWEDQMRLLSDEIELATKEIKMHEQQAKEKMDEAQRLEEILAANNAEEV